MKTNPDTNHLPNGTEVNIQIKKTHRIEFFFLLLALYIGAVLYSYIWEDLLADGVGYHPTSLTETPMYFLIFICTPLAYYLFQYLLLLFLSGWNTKAVRFASLWSDSGAYSSRPLPLKRHRLFLLLPGVLIGLLPLVHGFCMENKGVYLFGIGCLILAINDVRLFWKLRPFDGEDLFHMGKKTYQGTVIRRNYPKKD